MKSDADYKKAERQRKRAAGLVPMEVWVPRNAVAKVRAYVARLVRGSGSDSERQGN